MKILPYGPSRGRCWLIDWLRSPKVEDEVAVAERFDDIGLVPPDLLLLSPDPEVLLLASWSVGWPAFLRIRLMEETDGMLFGSQIRCPSSWSLISQANKAGFSDFNRRILLTTDGVATCCYWYKKFEYIQTIFVKTYIIRKIYMNYHFLSKVFIRYLWFCSTNGSWFDRASLVESCQNFWYASMRN